LKKNDLSVEDVDHVWDAIVSDEKNSLTKIETYAYNSRLFSPRHTNEPLYAAVNLQASASKHKKNS
jgi:hypothetical protein